MVELAERQQLLDELSRLAGLDTTALWNQLSAMSNIQFAEYLAEAFPEMLAQYSTAAAELGAEWFAESAPELPYQPTSFVPPAEGLPSSVSWALGATGEAAIPRLNGIAQAQIWDANRFTIAANAEAEGKGSTWARVARSGACAFCAMLSTRGAIYVSAKNATGVVGRGAGLSEAQQRLMQIETEMVEQRVAAVERMRGGRNVSIGGDRPGREARILLPGLGTRTPGGIKTRGPRELGKKFHDHCHCQAKEVRPGQSYEPPDYMSKFDDAYRDAVKAAGGASDPTAILSEMRTILGSK